MINVQHFWILNYMQISLLITCTVDTKLLITFPFFKNNLRLFIKNKLLVFISSIMQPDFVFLSTLDIDIVKILNISIEMLYVSTLNFCFS